MIQKENINENINDDLHNYDLINYNESDDSCDLTDYDINY